MHKNSSGMTLVELIVAMVVVSVGVLGSIGAMSLIQRSIQASKTKTLAYNLAQEKMQIIKQMNYSSVLVSTSPSTFPDPSFQYDNQYFTPESILEGSINFQRLALVQLVTDNSGTLTVLSGGIQDTGLKLITVYVVWTIGGKTYNISIQSTLSNPLSVMSNSNISGTVTSSAGGAAIAGALVQLTQNSGWQDSTAANGQYLINASPGNFYLVGSAPGYFDSAAMAVTLNPNANTPKSFTLTPMSYGTVTGTAWVNPGLVISQVVVSSAQAGKNQQGVAFNNFVAQYVELFNPTTAAVNIAPTGTIPNGSNAAGNPAVGLYFGNSAADGASYVDCTNSGQGILLHYRSTYTIADAYYLIANTGTFMVNGAWVTADAVFDDQAGVSPNCGTAPSTWNTASSPPVKLIMPPGKSGSVGISSTTSLSQMLDIAGWSDSNTPPSCETSCINFGAGGFPAGQQIVRLSSPSATADSVNFGRAYDSGSNTIDFLYPPNATTVSLGYLPHSTAFGAQPVIAGVPAVGAVISATDGLSVSTRAYLSGTTLSYSSAVFALTDVATGTWSVFIASNGYFIENDTVTIPASSSVYNFPSSTTIINTLDTQGYIEGTVFDALGAPISAPSAIWVTPLSGGSAQKASVATGRYLLRVTPGYIDVYANSASAPNYNSSYLTASSLSVPVTLGVVTPEIDFYLSQGGRIQGFVTRDGVNGLSGVAISAIDSNGYADDTKISDVNGRFTTTYLATGTYAMTPALDTLETSVPTSSSAVVSVGATVFSATFTITGAMGVVTGTVTVGGVPLNTGALIVVTTTTLSPACPASIAVPPSISSASLAMSPIYLGSTGEDGIYSLNVRQTPPTVNIYAYYTTLASNGALTTQCKVISGVTVVPGVTLGGQNFAWP